MTPHWSVNLDAKKFEIFLTFRMPLFRHLDGLDEAALRAWTGLEATKTPEIFRLPDATANYRIAIDSIDGAASSPEVDLLQRVSDKRIPSLGEIYVAQTVGERFTDVKFAGVRDEDGKKWAWAMDITARQTVRPGSGAPSSATLPDAKSIVGELSRFRLRPEDADAWQTTAPRSVSAFVFVPNATRADLNLAFTAAVTSLKSFVVDQETAKVHAWLLDGLAATESDAAWNAFRIQHPTSRFGYRRPFGIQDVMLPNASLRFADGPWSWPDGLAPNHEERRTIARILIAGLSTKTQEAEAARYSALMRLAWSRRHLARVFLGFAPAERRAPEDVTLEDLEVLPSPFGSLAKLPFKFEELNAVARRQAVGHILKRIEDLAASQAPPVGLIATFVSASRFEAMSDAELEAVDNLFVLDVTALVVKEAITGVTWETSGAEIRMRLVAPATDDNWDALTLKLSGMENKKEIIESFDRLATEMVFGLGQRPAMWIFKGVAVPVASEFKAYGAAKA